MALTEPVLEVKDLTTRFDTQDGMVHAVSDVSFTLNKGEFLGVVGESGSGKSVTVMSLLRLIRCRRVRSCPARPSSRKKTSSP